MECTVITYLSNSSETAEDSGVGLYEHWGYEMMGVMVMCFQPYPDESSDIGTDKTV